MAPHYSSQSSSSGNIKRKFALKTKIDTLSMDVQLQRVPERIRLVYPEFDWSSDEDIFHTPLQPVRQEERRLKLTLQVHYTCKTKKKAKN